MRADAQRRKKKRRWAEECRPSGPQSDDEEDDVSPGAANQPLRQRREFWTESLQQSFREQLEKLVILDYIMRNTDRGLDNWMIRIDQKTQEASIVAEPPQMDVEVDEDPESSSYTRQSMSEMDPYGRREPMTATSRSNTPMPKGPTPSVSIGAIDNSLSWPWKHPDAVRCPELPMKMVHANTPTVAKLSIRLAFPACVTDRTTILRSNAQALPPSLDVQTVVERYTTCPAKMLLPRRRFQRAHVRQTNRRHERTGLERCRDVEAS